MRRSRTPCQMHSYLPRFRISELIFETSTPIWKMKKMKKWTHYHILQAWKMD